MQYLTAILGVVAAIFVLRPVALRAGLIDTPGGRRQHATAVPLVGGLAIGIGLAFALLLRGTLDPAPPALVASCLIVLAAGTIDDRIELSARFKLLFQIIAATVLVEFSDTLLLHVGALFSPALQGLGVVMVVPFTILGLVGVMNAMNMIDGADGLAGGIALSALFWFGVAASMAGMPAHASLIGLFGCAVVSYLCFNAAGPLSRKYQVFLGDAGSLLIGLLLAWIAIDLTMAPFPPIQPITAVWILAVPICDSVSLMLRRASRRRSPFSPDREHLHHLLQDLGCSSGQAAALMVAISVGFGGIAMLAERIGVPGFAMFYLSMVIFAGFTVCSARFFAQRRAPAR